MGDHELPDLAAASPSRATDLIADFHERHEAWRRQGENLARLRADARAAASKEADTILTAARADIRRIVVDARRALLVLTAQLQAITEPGGASGHEQDEPVPESVLQARRDLQRLLAEVRPELAEVADQVRHFNDADAAPESPAATPIESSLSVADIDREAAISALAPLFDEMSTVESAPVAAAPVPGPVQLPVATDPVGPSRLGKVGAITAVVALAAVLLGGGGWWLSNYIAESDDLAPPLAFIPRAPRVKPSWLDEQMPTLTASLVALPAATTGATPSADATPAASVGVSVDIEMRREAWVQSSIDGGAATSRLFRLGESQRLSGVRGISITVRDAGAVLVSFNGGPRAPLGPDGQVVTRRFAVGESVSP